MYWTLLGRAVTYARARGIEIAVIDGPAYFGYIAARAGPDIIIGLTSGTAHGPDCGEIVYRACEAIAASRALEVKVHQSVRCRRLAS